MKRIPMKKLTRFKTAFTQAYGITWDVCNEIITPLCRGGNWGYMVIKQE